MSTPPPEPEPPSEPGPPSESDPEPGPEQEPEQAVAADDVAGTTPSREGWSFIALIAEDSQEPAANLPERAALATWCAVSAPWHPSLLAHAAELPRIESVDYPSGPGPNEVRVVAAGTTDRLPSGYQTQ